MDSVELNDANLNAANLRSMYEKTTSEISRYRDREWKNEVLFTGAIAAIIGYNLEKGANCDGLTYLDYFLSSAVFLLAIANIGYTSYAHMRLAENRSLMAKLEDMMRIDNVRCKPLEKDLRANFHKGYVGHLLPFFIISALLAVVGLYSMAKSWHLIFIAILFFSLQIVITYFSCLESLRKKGLPPMHPLSGEKLEKG